MHKKLVSKIIFFIVIVHFSNTYADNLTIFNKTHIPIYSAIYYSKNRTAQRIGSLKTINPNAHVVLERHSYKVGYDRELLISAYNSALKDELAGKELADIVHHNVGYLKGKTFYIDEYRGGLRIYTTGEWNVGRPIAKKIEKVVDACKAIIDKSEAEFIKQVQQAHEGIQEQLPAEISRTLLQGDLYAKNPYKDKVASVRIGNGLCQQEKIAINARLKRIQAKLKNPPYVPKIAFVGSGGGYRCLMMMLGALVGAEKEELLDTFMWVVGLSGSAWALGALCATQVERGRGQKVEEFKDEFISYITGKGIRFVSVTDITQMSTDWLTHIAFSQPFTVVNMYGAIIANHLLGLLKTKKHETYLSDQAVLAQSGASFIPIYTALQADPGFPTQGLGWYEYTPWEVGGAWLGMYVPSWAYGRKFSDGKSVDDGLEKSFGFHLGLYGSAFAASLEQLYLDMESKLESPILKKLFKWVVETELGKKRLAWGEVYNFTKGIAQSPVKDLKTLRAVDAGLAFNLPYPPVSGERPDRQADIIIVFDASSSIKGAEQLHKMENYARCKGLPFPPINYTDIDKKVVSVFKDVNDRSKPVVIYLPRVNDANVWKNNSDAKFQPYRRFIEKFNIEQCVSKEFCGTFNFNYSYEQAQQLSMLAEFNMRYAAPVIWQEIAACIEAHLDK